MAVINVAITTPLASYSLFLLSNIKNNNKLSKAPSASIIQKFELFQKNEKVSLNPMFFRDENNRIHIQTPRVLLNNPKRSPLKIRCFIPISGLQLLSLILLN